MIFNHNNINRLLLILLITCSICNSNYFDTSRNEEYFHFFVENLPVDVIRYTSSLDNIQIFQLVEDKHHGFSFKTLHLSKYNKPILDKNESLHANLSITNHHDPMTSAQIIHPILGGMYLRQSMREKKYIESTSSILATYDCYFLVDKYGNPSLISNQASILNNGKFIKNDGDERYSFIDFNTITGDKSIRLSKSVQKMINNMGYYTDTTSNKDNVKTNNNVNNIKKNKLHGKVSLGVEQFNPICIKAMQNNPNPSIAFLKPMISIVDKKIYENKIEIEHYYNEGNSKEMTIFVQKLNNYMKSLRFFESLSSNNTNGTGNITNPTGGGYPFSYVTNVFIIVMVFIVTFIICTILCVLFFIDFCKPVKLFPTVSDVPGIDGSTNLDNNPIPY